jgi:hypothetical protein
MLLKAAQYSIPGKHRENACLRYASRKHFLASSFFCSQAESMPAHLRLTPAVGLHYILCGGMYNINVREIDYQNANN